MSFRPTIFSLNTEDDDDTTRFHRSSDKINVDELYEKKHQKDLKKLKTYEKILARIHNKIKQTSRQRTNDQCCWVIIPEYILGCVYYDNQACTSYVIHKLVNNGFNVKYIHPNVLIISWAHLVPSYIRAEIQDKTGMKINEFGEYIFPNADTLPASYFEEKQNQPQFQAKQPPPPPPPESKFKTINTHKPLHTNIMYDPNILHDIYSRTTK